MDRIDWREIAATIQKVFNTILETLVAVVAIVAIVSMVITVYRR